MPEHPMPLEERAKQFAPFKSLPGLEKALEKKEQEILAQYPAEINGYRDEEAGKGDIESREKNKI